MSVRRKFDLAGEVALKILQHMSTIADVAPPLKTVAESALRIIDIAERSRDNRSEWDEFNAYVKDVTSSVLQSLDQIGGLNNKHTDDLQKLKQSLDETADRIELEQSKRLRKRLGKFLQAPDLIGDLKAQIDKAITLFYLNSTIKTMVHFNRLQGLTEATDPSPIVSGIVQGTSSVLTKATYVDDRYSFLAQNSAIDKLQRIQGASWNTYRACLPNTRVGIVEDIMTWIDGNRTQPDKKLVETAPGLTTGARIMLLTAVAGAGKTTIAHTIAQICHKRGCLASSFFFDHGTEGRNSTATLFSTIAADISRLDRRLAERIATAIEDDRSLPSAPASRQFEELVLAPCRGCYIPGPVVVVIDALDEAWDNDWPVILSDRMAELPTTFRIFLTSRMRPELNSVCRKSHVRQVDLDVGSRTNKDDVESFALHKLAQLAQDRGFEDNWPGEHLRTQFLAKAGGLFLWVATVYDYLRNRDDPSRELSELVLTAGLSVVSAEARMDILYATILESFEWTDASFVSSYQRVMGTAVSSKIPLTISTIKRMYHDKLLASNYTLQRLSPLLTGMSILDHDKQPVKVLHQSLRDFLVVRAGGSPRYAKFRIVENTQNQQLALLCLEILNRELNEEIPGIGHLSKDEASSPGIPSMCGAQIPEAILYACQFWIDHLVDASQCPITRNALQRFMSGKAVMWLEIVAIISRCRGLKEARTWMQEQNNSQMIQISKTDHLYANACLLLSTRLVYEDRREEAFEMTEEAVTVYRSLCSEDPVAFTSSLATALHGQWNRLYDLGEHEKGLLVIQESIKLCRQLSKDQPSLFTSDLAVALNGYSLCLLALDRCQDALLVVQEAIKLRRQIATDQATISKANLAKSLNNLYLCLYDLDSYEQALTAIRESVIINRQLVASDPAIFTHELAKTLNNLSNCLLELCQYEEASTAIEESITLYRGLATDRPAVFTSDLAMSLNNFSRCLLKKDLHEGALTAVEEAVSLRRQLAIKRPTVSNHRLALYLDNLSECLCGLGRFKEALPKMHEATELRRQLVIAKPKLFIDDLKYSLRHLSDLLIMLDRHPEAAAVHDELANL